MFLFPTEEKDRSIEYSKPSLVAQTVDYPLPNPKATPLINPSQLFAGRTVKLDPYHTRSSRFILQKSGQPSTSVGPVLYQG